MKTRHTVLSLPWVPGHVLSARIESELSEESITNIEDLMEVTHTLEVWLIELEGIKIVLNDFKITNV